MALGKPLTSPLGLANLNYDVDEQKSGFLSLFNPPTVDTTLLDSTNVEVSQEEKAFFFRSMYQFVCFLFRFYPFTPLHRGLAWNSPSVDFRTDSWIPLACT